MVSMKWFTVIMAVIGTWFVGVSSLAALWSREPGVLADRAPLRAVGLECVVASCVNLYSEGTLRVFSEEEEDGGLCSVASESLISSMSMRGPSRRSSQKLRRCPEASGVWSRAEILGLSSLRALLFIATWECDVVGWCRVAG